MSRAWSLAALAVALPCTVACVRVPNALNPAVSGSIGTTSKGFLSNGVAIEDAGPTHWLRKNERHYGIPRFVRAIERAATKVAEERPPAVLVTGDLSMPHGGRISPHLSHASGRDADLLLYLVTLDGAPVTSPGFLSFDADGLAYDRFHGRYVRYDVEREWLLIKTLLTDDDARIQWVFISEVLKAITIEWARARGEDGETLERAMAVMHQPHPGGVHDDHIHVRTACSDDEITFGCDQTGPARWWHEPAKRPDADSTEELVLALLRPMDAASVSATR